MNPSLNSNGHDRGRIVRAWLVAIGAIAGPTVALAAVFASLAAGK